MVFYWLRHFPEIRRDLNSIGTRIIGNFHSIGELKGKKPNNLKVGEGLGIKEGLPKEGTFNQRKDY